MSEFVAKYADVSRRWPPAEWAQEFTQAILVVPTKLTAWTTKPGVSPEHRSMRF
jgi:hypothetical protein